MVDPIRMVVIDLAASIVLIVSLFVYKRIFPKKKINLLVLLLLISLLPLISILRPGSYESGDLSYHVKFAMPFFDNIMQGNLLPRWMENNCSGYGCPAYIFIFLLSHYLISGFHFLGFSFIDSAKIVMILSFLISGIGMFLWIKEELGEKPAFVAAIFYLFAPYHLIDLHFRVSIAELVSMAILPFLFLTTKRLIATKLFGYFIYTSILFALLITSHQVTSFASFPLLLIYGTAVWIRNRKKFTRGFLLMFVSYITGVLLTAFYWLPIFIENKYTLYNLQNQITFHPFRDFFYSPNKFGLLFQGHMGELYTIIGYTQWLVVIIGAYILLKRKIKGKEKILLAGSLSVFFILFVMMQSFTKPIWDVVPIIKNFQFSWRLSIEAIIAIAIVAGIVVKTYTNKKFFLVLCFVTVAYTILNWANRGAVPQITDTVLRNQPIWNDYPGQIDVLTPILVDIYKPWIGIIPKKHIEVLTGKAEIVEVTHLITRHEYVVSAITNTQIKENTFYFPGWKLLVNNKEVKINYKNKDFPGVITFDLNKGLYKIELIFTDTIDRKIGKWISIITAIIIGGALIIRSKRLSPK
jgi:hypothetical protein